MKLIKIILIILTIHIANYSFAHFDLEGYQIVEIPVDNVTRKLTYDDMKKVMPYNELKSMQGKDSAVKLVADRSLRYWMENTEIKNNQLIRKANEVNQSMRAEVAVSQHRFTLQYEPFQSIAQIRYSGWLTANLNYYSRDAYGDILLSQKIFQTTDLIIQKIISAADSTSIVQLGWNF